MCPALQNMHTVQGGDRGPVTSGRLRESGEPGDLTEDHAASAVELLRLWVELEALINERADLPETVGREAVPDRRVALRDALALRVELAAALHAEIRALTVAAEFAAPTPPDPFPDVPPREHRRGGEPAPTLAAPATAGAYASVPRRTRTAWPLGGIVAALALVGAALVQPGALGRATAPGAPLTMATPPPTQGPSAAVTAARGASPDGAQPVGSAATGQPATDDIPAGSPSVPVSPYRARFVPPGTAEAGAPPRRLEIPSIGVAAPVVEVGITLEGVMEDPPLPDVAAWYRESAAPGRSGNSVLSGHLDWGRRQGVFWNLRTLAPGDAIRVRDGEGGSWDYVVIENETFPTAAAPLDRLLDPAVMPVLTLITCDGTWDSRAKEYSNRRFVRAVLAES